MCIYLFVYIHIAKRVLNAEEEALVKKVTTVVDKLIQVNVFEKLGVYLHVYTNSVLFIHEIYFSFPVDCATTFFIWMRLIYSLYCCFCRC